jgi:Ca-activated chloride channel family protein
MEWQQPQWLYLILPLGLAWLALAVYSRRRRRRAAAAFVAQPMWSRILPADSPSRFWVKTLFREIALVTGLVALAGPRFGSQIEEIVPKGSDLYVLIDVSRSMLAQDVPPSRLGRAKADVAALVNRLDGERVGLIAFAGQAVVKCPLTVDYDAFRRALDELDPNSAPRGGTAIGEAIRKALEVFQARAERDQAILLITDGDDQQSYPLDAAAAAAERHVTVFSVGLGDADHGARIPQSGETKSYLEYQGQQVWSKLDGTLLKDIAIKTSGVYVPAGTRSYDLGELYTKYLQGRRGAEEQSKKRIRRGERFQIFLGLSLMALVIDALIPPYRRLVKSVDDEVDRRVETPKRARTSAAMEPASVAMVLALIATDCGVARADTPANSVREGVRLYGRGEFAKARDSFAAAREQFDRKDAGKAAVAAFDQACAAHRKGDVAQAKEWYLKAGLATDKRLAAAAHFNLGTLAAEEARRLAGEHPENVPTEKRPEILDQVKAAVASLRHCLDLEPDHTAARRDIELLRQWVKYYGERWRAADREKRRRETNLLTFVEFLIETETGLAESSNGLSSTSNADAYFELKRLQDELLEEIPPLKEKIQSELQPPPTTGGSAPQPNLREAQQAIALLQGWATAAGEKMRSASRQLDGKRAQAAAADQEAAVEELAKIWEAVIPFHPLLARDLADQTRIAESLAPASPGETKENPGEPAAKATPSPAQEPRSTSVVSESDDLAPLTRTQERTRRRTELLKLKAAAEREQLEKASPPAAEEKSKNSPSGQPDPEALKAGYQKAIDLAPRAVEQMDLAVKALKRADRQGAYPPAEEARKILEEIQKAQPQKPPDQKDQNQKKNEEQQRQQSKDQQQKQDEEKKQDEQKKDQGKNDEQKKDQEKSEQQKEQEKKQQDKDQQKQDEQQRKDQQKKQSDAQKKDNQRSRDQIESVLRKVRERQQAKNERDRMMKARVMGRVPVEKDW